MTFNYRYSPRNSAVREIIADGVVGDVTSVVFERVSTPATVRTTSGVAREKRFSGGLLVHKAAHHFDLVNWWLDAVPVEVVARGTRRVYGPDGAASLAPGRSTSIWAPTPSWTRCSVLPPPGRTATYAIGA